MQSHFGKAQAGRNDVPAAVGPRPYGISPGSGSTCEQSALLGPVQRQIKFGQTRRGQLDGLPALHDRFDQFRAQKRKTNEPADITPGDAVTLGQRLQRRRAGRWPARQTTRARARSP